MTAHALFDPDAIKPLLDKYNQNAPRYTSYPTALHLSPTQDAHTKALKGAPSAPLSLYVHIPFCRHLCYYCACNKIITKKSAVAGDYLSFVFDEVAQKKRLLNKEALNKVEQLHLGGGTPTFLSEEELGRLTHHLRNVFDFVEDGDYSVEIDPRAIQETTLPLLRDLGYNRLSFGVQDFNHKTAKAVNRVQPYELVKKYTDQARAYGFGSLNFDLICGLPYQTPDTFVRTIEETLTLEPDRISIFNYAHLPTRFSPQTRIDEATLPASTQKVDMFLQAATTLMDAGYEYIGIDHFAKQNDALTCAKVDKTLVRNFQGYTTKGGTNLLGFGVSSISQLGDYVVQNPHQLGDYEAFTQTLKGGRAFCMSADDKVRHYVIMQLLCHEAVSFDAFLETFGVEFERYFTSEMTRLMHMQEDGILECLDTGIRILPKGRMFARTIAAVFDHYLSGEKPVRFSQVV